jgi:hypothetical protein
MADKVASTRRYASELCRAVGSSDGWLRVLLRRLITRDLILDIVEVQSISPHQSPAEDSMRL